jgi:prolyl 4-hydroxylase
MEYDDFLTGDECDTLISLAQDRLEPSNVYNESTDKPDQQYRISTQAWFKKGSDAVVQKIDAFAASMSGLPDTHHEELQVVKYEEGGFFSPHYDACYGKKDFCDRMNSEGGPRLWTFMVYLNDGFQGGETHFPKTDASVVPKKGKLIVFQNTMDDEDRSVIKDSFHGGNPVQSGEKWICNKWVRHMPYRQ